LEIHEEFLAQYFVKGIKDLEVKKTLKMFKGNNSSELLVKATCNDLKPKVRPVSIGEEKVPPNDY